jgi:hypothetical protein
MQANIFGEIPLSCLVTAKKKQGLYLDPNRVTDIEVTTKLKPIKIKKSSNTAWLLSPNQKERAYNANAFGSLYKDIRLLVNNGYENDEVKRILKVTDEQIKIATSPTSV